MQIVKYISEDEVAAIIAAKEAQGLRLCAISNITEGNFLGFEEVVAVKDDQTSLNLTEEVLVGGLSIEERLHKVELLLGLAEEGILNENSRTL